MYDLLILNAKVVNEGKVTEQDVAIKGQRIERLGSDLSGLEALEVIDAAGKVLMPGMIDDQVHFREPGFTHKGDLATESRAAIAGGTTSFMEMPNVKPATLTLEALEEKYQRASGRAHANYAFYLGASNDNIDEIKSLAPGQACGVKVFMGASTGNLLVDRLQSLEAIFRESPVLIATHCEDTPMIHANEKVYRERYGDDIPMGCHPYIRSEEACYASSSLAVSLARQFGTQLHVLHITTARELSLFSSGPIENKSITAEACVHHLYFSEEDYERLGTLIKCNPAIKTQKDRDALLQAVKNDVIDVIATDHAPHTREEKENTYFKAPAGLPLSQHALLSLFAHVDSGVLTLEQVVHKVAHAPAIRYKVRERGFIREGYFADLVLVDRQRPYRVEPSNILYKCGWSPFEGTTFGSTIDTTIVNGSVVYRLGQFLGEPQGERLDFQQF